MTPRTRLDTLFLKQGTEVIVPEHHRLVVEDDPFVWFLIEGSADLFFIDLVMHRNLTKNILFVNCFFIENQSTIQCNLYR